MRATDFEFRNRAWILSAIFIGAFASYGQQSASVAARIVRALAEPHADGDRLRFLMRMVFVGSIVCAILAAWLRTWAAAYLDSDVVHDTTLHSDRVVADGPYRFLRNPLYLGLLLLALAMAPITPPWGAVWLLGAVWLFQRRLIAREEAELLASQGESYRQFLNAVPRLIPALTPRLPASGKPARWGQAFLGEGFLWIFAAAVVLLTVTLNGRLFGIACGVAMLLYVALRRTAGLRNE